MIPTEDALENVRVQTAADMVELILKSSAKEGAEPWFVLLLRELRAHDNRQREILALDTWRKRVRR